MEIENNVTEKYFKNPIGNLYDFYLYEVGMPENFTEWNNTIANAGEKDVIIFHINSNGGFIFTALQLINSIRRSNALCVASVEGLCASAATFIFLSCEQHIIAEHSMFMFHNYSGGTFGKGGEMYDAISHEREWSKKLLSSFYEGFLTNAEIELILDNKDIWMDSEEVYKRLKKRQKYFEKLQKKLKKQIDNGDSK